MKKIFLKFLVAAAVFALIAGAVYAFRTSLSHLAEGTFLERFLPSGDDDDHDHEAVPVSGCGHDHGSAKTEEPSHDDHAAEISLSSTAAKNIGLDDSAILTVETTDFYKSLTFPAVVVERPGFSAITIPSPVSGVVTKIYHETGVAVAPGEPLFDILLNQQELVKAQTEFLAMLKKREINAAEMRRLSDIDPQIIPKQWRDLEIEKMQIDSEIEIQKKILLLQGLSEKDVTVALEKSGKIIRHMTVHSPPFVNNENVASTAHADDEEHIYTIDELRVTVGKNIAVGESLCELTDYCKLAIQGKVFAVNEKVLVRALASKSRVSATFEGSGERETVGDLVLRSIDNRIDAGGTLFCYVDLKNHFTSYKVNGEGNLRQYTQWHFKPGQRCELHVEAEPLPNCIVLPVDAVAKDLQEMCVFEWVGSEDGKKIWRKKPVHVVHQTKDAIVIANDGSISPGAKVAVRGAGFILAALEAANQKTAGGGGIQHGDHVH